MTRANFCKIKLCERKESYLVELSLSLAAIGLRQIQMAGDICVENEQRVFLLLLHQQDAGCAGHCSHVSGREAGCAGHCSHASGRE